MDECVQTEDAVHKSAISCIMIDRELQITPLTMACEIQVERYRFEASHDSQTEQAKMKHMGSQSDKVAFVPIETQTDPEITRKSSVASSNSSFVVSSTSSTYQAKEEKKGERKEKGSDEIFFHMVSIV